MLWRVTDRDLRDEIEQLSTELGEARKQLDFSKSVSAGAEQLRTLTAGLASARLQCAALKQQVPATEALLAAREEERSMLQDELASARKRIAELDPPANPLEQTAPDWNPNAQTTGCLQVVVLGFIALALGWWLT
jgi:chromosome segregation ATPase